MNYTTCIAIFKSTAAQVNASGNFVYGKRPDAALLSSNTSWPLIVLLPFRETEDRKNKTIKRNCVMFFVTKDDPNNSIEERETIVSQMDVLQRAYLNEFEEQLTGKGIIDGPVLKTPEWQTFPGYGSGYSISFTLSSKMPIC